MEFTAGLRKNRKNPKKVISDNLSELYPHNLQMYTVPPASEITLSEFEDLALERLQLLRLLEQTRHKGHKVFSADWAATIKVDLRKQRLIKYLNLVEPTQDNQQQFQARRADHISHFILRLAYCRSLELRQWFLAREQEWFKLRFMKLRPEDVKNFLEANNLIYTAISNEEKQEMRDQLYESTSWVNGIDLVNFYKIPFDEVLPLIAKRRVFVNKGYAYIPDSELAICVVNVFKTQLNEALAYACRRIPALDDDRLNYLLKNIHVSYVGQDYSNKYDSSDKVVTIESLDHLARKHYPLCMRYMHETFRSTHHMKYNCRLQYGLFTKAIGLAYEDALRFWKEEYTKLIDETTFEKKYSYVIKYNYGLVGSRVNYLPMSCMKIIQTAVGVGEHHGCPFRHFDATNLREKLNEYGVSPKGIDEIMELVKNFHYQIACSKYYEYTHGEPPKNVINHPNQFFEESTETLKNQKKKPKISFGESNKLDDIYGET